MKELENMRDLIDRLNGIAGSSGTKSGNLLALLESHLDEGVAIHDPAHMVAYTIAVAEAFDAAPKYEASARKSYDALNYSNNKVLLKRIEGDGITLVHTPDDPYDDGSGDEKMMVRRMLWDMTVNHRLAIYSGHSSDHPVFSETENVVFRTVHDFFTHGKLRKIFASQVARRGLADKMPSPEELTRLLPTISLEQGGNLGHQFTLRGEMNSYSSHAKLAPPIALPALFSEVVGQVCYKVLSNEFPEQKAVVLADFDYRHVGKARPGSRADRRIAQIMQQIKDGAQTINTTVKAVPEVNVREVMKSFMHESSDLDGDIITEAGAGLSRIVGHLQKGHPFLQLTGARKGLTPKEIAERNHHIFRTLRKMGLGPIKTVGNFDEMDPDTNVRSPVIEPSMFVPLSPRTEIDPDTLLDIGSHLALQFNQDSIIYGDGRHIFALDFVNDDIDQIGDYDALDTHEMPYGSTSIKNKQPWAWTHNSEPRERPTSF